MDAPSASMIDEPMDDDSQGPAARGQPLPPPAPPGARAHWFDVPVMRQPRSGPIGGVIAGLSSAYGFDRRLARLVVIVLTFVVPALILVYVAAWILLPSEPDPPQSLRHVLTDRHRLPLFVLLGLGLVLSGVVTTNDFVGLRGLGWAIALIVVGVMLWLVPERGVERAPGEPPAWAPPTDASLADPPVAGTPWASAPLTGAPAAVAPPLPAPRRARAPRRPVGSVALAAVTVAVGCAITGDALDWWRLSTVGTVVTVALALAVATIASALANLRFGRLVLVAPLAAIAAFTAIVSPDLSGGVGERDITVTATATGRERLAVGELTLDARGLTTPANPSAIRVDASVGVGRLHVIVPAGAGLVVRAHVGAGHLVVDGDEIVDGVRFDHELTRAASAGAPTIELDVRVGMGEIAIDHATALR